MSGLIVSDVCFQSSEQLELYDLQQDIGEMTDLSDASQDRVTTMRTLYDQWNGGNLPSFFPSFRNYWKNMDAVHRDPGSSDQSPPAVRGIFAEDVARTG